MFPDTLKLLGSQAVLFGLIAWLGKLWIERILARERHVREKELEKHKSDQQLAVNSQLEKLRADLSQQHASVTASIAAASAAASLGHKERLKAVDQMWRACMCNREAVGPAIAFWDIIYSFKREGKAYYRQQLDAQALAAKCRVEEKETEALRPFLGEELWSLYFGYRMILGRASIPLGLALSRAEEPEDFFEDTDVQRLLGGVLTEEEQHEFGVVGYERLKWLLARFERKIMAGAERLISGRQAALETHEQSLRLVDLARQLDNNKTT